MVKSEKYREGAPMAIKKKEYRDFSKNLHDEAGHKPVVAQMELTYSCPLHCGHCLTDCYNTREQIARELPAEDVTRILDKCKSAGVLWFCFTGGDPMTKRGFSEIYLHAKKTGLITTVFSSLTAMDEEILCAFKFSPPFNIETTLNAATEETYRAVTGTGLFKAQINGIEKLLENGISLRVKTQVTRQNYSEITAIKKLVESFGLDFRPSTMLYARLNGETAPCSVRLEPAEAALFNGKYGFFDEEEARLPGEKLSIAGLLRQPEDNKLLTCAAGGHSFWIDPRGQMILCGTLRNFSYDLLKEHYTVEEGFSLLYDKIHGLRFETDSRCRKCRYRIICKWCPGKAMLEKGSMEEPIDYFCELAEETVKSSRA